MKPAVASAVGAVLREKVEKDPDAGRENGQREALTLFVGLCVNIARIADTLDKGT